MALTDIVFGQENSSEAARGNTGVVVDNLSEEAMTILIQSGVMQRWNAALARWDVVPLRYRSGDGWV